MQIPYIPADPNFLNKKQTNVFNPFGGINTPQVIVNYILHFKNNKIINNFQK